MSRVVRQRIWLRKDEVLDALEAYDEGRRTYYSYTYRVRREATWSPLVRWDNWDGQDHADRYDEAGLHRQRTPTRERTLVEVLRIVKSFRRNLLSIDLAEV